MKKLNKIKWLIKHPLWVGLVVFGVLSLLIKVTGSAEADRVAWMLQSNDFNLVGPERRAFANFLVDTAKDNDFDPLLIMAIMKVESEFRTDAVSHRGAMGLLQLKPVAAREVADQINFKIKSKHELLDPFKNLAIGVQYLVHLRELFGYDLHKILTAYNMGPTLAKQLHTLPQGYVRKVLRAYQDLNDS